MQILNTSNNIDHVVSKWTYKYEEHGTEVGWLNSDTSKPLRTHFHQQTQIACVKRGQQVFHLPGGEVVCEVGSVLVIPAGTVHTSSSPQKCQVTNLYIETDAEAARGITEVQFFPLSTASNTEEVLDLVGSSRRDLPLQSIRGRNEMMESVAHLKGSIRGIAAEYGYSTDGFIRRFFKEVGITPAQYRLAHRLSLARSLLRDGISSAEAAFGAGFADQSHLVREFVRSYGTTPAVYQAGFENLRSSPAQHSILR